MLLDFALILVLAIAFHYLFTKIGLPGILGMIIAGVVLGPSFLDVVNPEVQHILKEFKTVALIVILIRAGLGISRKTLKKVGGPAIRMSFIPGVFEGTVVLIVSHFLLGFSIVEAGMLGFIIAAVSPAVVVPQMLDLKEKEYGKNKEVPTLILAGASLDDVFAITIFSAFVAMASSGSINLGHILWSVPTGIFLGAAIGAAIGFALVWFFRRFHFRDTKKVILFMLVAVVFYEITEMEQLKSIVPLAGLLGIMAMGYVILEKYAKLANRLAAKFNKMWILAEVMLFVYIGTEVRMDQIDTSLIAIGLLILFVGLTARSIGVWISLLRSDLNNKERLFSVIAYWPKATVQAAIGAVPLALIMDGKMDSVSLVTGQTILAIAVLSIVVTAPLGAIGIKLSGPRLLKKG